MAPSLSALAVTNVARATGSEIPITKFKSTMERNEFYAVELKVGDSNFYGELTIVSYLIRTANEAGDKKWLA